MASRVKQVFSGTPTTVISITGNIANGYVCGNNTPLDNTTDAYPFGYAVLAVPAGFGAAPAANAPIGLWAVPQYDAISYVSPGSGVDATPAAQTGFKSTAGAVFLGSFLCGNSSSPQTLYIPKIVIKGWKVAKYFISNDSGVVINAGAAGNTLTLIITLWADGSV